MNDPQYYAIGEAAGKIYRVLEEEGERTVTQLQKSSAIADAALFNQALGWLAREANISITKQGRAVKVSLIQVNI